MYINRFNGAMVVCFNGKQSSNLSPHKNFSLKYFMYNIEIVIEAGIRIMYFLDRSTWFVSSVTCYSPFKLYSIFVFHSGST